MNKLFTKIVGVALGLTMAIGVGVAVGSSGKEATPVHAAGGTFKKITSTSDLTSGAKYLIVSESDNLAFDGSLSTIDAVSNTKSVTISSNSITTTADFYFTITSKTGGYSIKGSGGKYIGSTSSNANELKSGTSDSYTNTITWDATNSCFIIRGTNSYLVYNSSSGQTRFRFFKPTTCGNGAGTGSYHKISLFKEQSVTNYTVTFEVGQSSTGYGTVSSSSLSVPSGSSISVNSNKVTINNTTVTATPNASTAQYTYAFSSWSNTSGTVTAARTITANFTRTTNTFTVGDTITNGALSSTAEVEYGSPLNITINPDSGYKLPSTLTSVTMGGSAYAGYTYDSATGDFSIASVTGNVVINATCPVDATTYTISGSITNGSLTGDAGEQVEDQDYGVQISPSALYKYPTSVTVTGAGEEGEGWEYYSPNGIVYIYGLSANVTITATCPAASITSIFVTGQKTAFTLGENFSFGGTVKASYDDVAHSTNVTISTDLVSVDSSAYDAFTESNSYTISVALKSNGSVSTSYTVSVTRKSISTTTTYVKVSASKSDWSGKYVILSSDNAYVMGTTITSSRVTNGTLSDLKNSSGNAISSVDTVIASGYTNYVYTIAKSGNYYTISPDTGTNAGKYLAGTSAKNQASFISDGTDDLAKWTITYSSGFVFENLGRASQTDPNNRYLRSNTTSGFACYSSSQSKAPHLFAKTDTPSGTKSLIRITATGPADNEKKEDDILTAADFTVTALYDTADFGTVTQNVSVTSGATLVAGSNTVTLSYTEGGVTKTCQVTVVAAENTANLDGIVWSQEDVSRTIFEGSTIGSFGTLEKHYDDDSTVALSLDDCTVAVYNNTSGSKAHDVVDPSTYTWSLSNDDGKYLGVTYDEYTLYSGVVNVVENINAVYGKVEQLTFTTKASNTNPIAVGDTVVFAYDEANMEMVSITSGTKGVVDSFTTNPAGTYQLTVEEGYASGTYAFKNGSDYVAFTSSAASGSNNLWTQTTIDEKSSWTIEYDGTDVTIANCYNTGRSLRYNTSSNQERISGYVSSSTNFPLIQVYKGATAWVPSGDSIANTNAVVQKAVLEYAVHFNETMNCVNGGTTADVSGKWSTLSGDFDDLLSDFTGSDLTHCKALFAGADAIEGGDTLQDMLARYEYICAKYKLDDFLADIDRPPVAQRTTISPLSIIGSNGNTIAIIVVISMISVTAIGGYFFLRKRKEEI